MRDDLGGKEKDQADDSYGFHDKKSTDAVEYLIGILAGDRKAMILSSADILKILGGSEIIRLAARLSIVDGKPPLSGEEGLFISIDRFPRVDEFQATWIIYVESDGSEPDDLVITEIKKLLPGVKIKPGLKMILD